MKQITTAQLIEMIRTHKGTEIATIITHTDPKAKVACPVKPLVKVSKMNVMFGFNYENAVNNQRGREEIESDFVSAPRRWGNRIDLKTVEHEGQTYITLNCLKNFDTQFQDGVGRCIRKEDIETFLPAKRKSQTQGTEKEIVYRDVKAENIKEIAWRGENYIILG